MSDGEGVMAMASPRITIKVSSELADAFEAHAHQLAPASIVGKDTETDPYWWTYTLDWPDAPPGAVSVVPIWHASYQGDRATAQLYGLDWYDSHGRFLRGTAPAAAHGPAH